MKERPAFRLAERVSLPDSIADAIADGISLQALLPGDAVVESALARELGVSRVPVREALKVLGAQGIVEGGGHRSWRVVSFSREKIRQVMEVRIELEMILLRDAIERWRSGRASFEGLEQAIMDMRRQTAAGDRAGALRADVAFHRAICECSGNEIVATLWDAIARHVLIIFNLERRSADDLDGIVQQHESFLAFIRQQVEQPPDPQALRAAIEDHVLLVIGKEFRRAGATKAGEAAGRQP
ncbi:MAG: GntR family transcriptional regulator [Alsobacter sp.]